MNFDDCVLIFFFFHVFTNGDHGDPLLLSFRSSFRSFVVSMVPTIFIWSSLVVVDFCLYGTTNFQCAILAYFCL